jgi:hypothetical protein
MAQSAKITFVAVIVLLTGGLALITGAFALTIPKEDRTISVVVVVLGAWALATGVGILRFRRWARLSVLIFVGLTAYLGATFAPLIIALRTPVRPGVPALTEEGRVAILTACTLVIIVGLWCARVLATRPATELFGLPPAQRSFGIAVIAWYLTMAGITGGFGLFRIRHAPTVMTFGFVLNGWSAFGALLFYSAADLSLAIGLLRRLEQGRRLAIYYGIFRLLDVAVFFLRPDREARLKTYYNARIFYNPAAAQFSLDGLSRFMRLESIEWFVFTLVAVWFLVARKNEFAGTLETR